MEDVHVIFTMLRCNMVYVTEFGQLVGSIARDDLIHASQRHAAKTGSMRPPQPDVVQPAPLATLSQTLESVVDPHSHATLPVRPNSD